MFGVDVILADHHEPHSEGIPNEYAVINPKFYDSNYPFKDTPVWCSGIENDASSFNYFQ
jgi:single-stranded DNA-specific DHH superfamily exonuclease